jgi:F-type H+-transporting ATPase subunit gamma
MANLRDIKKRITSVTSTKQITRTMEMVATAKIRRATDRVVAATPYSNAMVRMLDNLAESDSGGDPHPLLASHAEKKHVLFIVAASDRGLAGAFNSNVLHAAEKKAAEYAAQDVKVDFILCGKKAIGYFAYRGIIPVMKFAGLSSDPTIDEARQIASYAREGYASGEIDEVTVFYNHARNAADQDLRAEQVLPIVVGTANADAKQAKGAPEEAEGSKSSFKFEPNKASVLSSLLPAYVVTMMYHALIDSACAEQGARRKAMKSATDNATDIIKTLQRQYNRARQGAITTEISEIVGGASALKKEE